MSRVNHTKPFDGAYWIWSENLGWDLYNGYVLMRRSIVLDGNPEEALVHISADQSYQLYINGKFVCRGPARGFQDSWPYDTVDVADYMHAGENIIAVRAYNPGFGNFQYVSRAYAGFIFDACFDGERLVSDDTWKVRRQEGIERGTVPVSIQQFPQEHIDLRIEPQDWMSSEFDDSEWNTPFKRLAYTIPWPKMEPRGIPMLEEFCDDQSQLIAEDSGLCASGYRQVRDVVGLRHSEGFNLIGKNSMQGGALRLGPSQASGFCSYLFDLGEVKVGSLELEVFGCRGGEIIDTLHVETINEETLVPDLKIPEWCRMAFGSRLVCREGANRHRFFHFYGYRYLLITVRDVPASLDAKFHLHRVAYPLKKNGTFASSDNRLTRIWEACECTQRLCSLDAYVDTPWREQAQWWGDARIQAWNTFHLDGDTRLFERGIRQVGTQLTPEGLTFGHAPTSSHHCVLPDFCLIWILTVWDHYWQAGSFELFKENHSIAQGILKYFKAHMDSDCGLVQHDPKHWLFLDWSELPAEGCPTLLSLWLLYTLERYSELCQLVDIQDDLLEVDQWAKTLRATLSNMVSADGLLGDGYAVDGKAYPSASIHVQTLASMLEITPEHRGAMFSKRILPWLRGESNETIVPSCYWAAYVLEEANRRGYGVDAVSCMHREWAEMAEFGTTFERFDGELGSSSRSHAWSAHPLYLLMQTVGGVRQTAPGWSEIHFEPVLYGKNCQTVIPTPLGKIQSSWSITGDTVDAELSLPEGMSASVYLPNTDHSPETVTGMSSWQWKR